MTAKMIRYDESYETKLMEFIDASEGQVELEEDPKLLYDPYYYQRKAQLDKTIEAIDNGSMKMFSQNEWDEHMRLLDMEIDVL